ncbi:sensor histidine kinase [Hephaestia caeni]|nr:HAMP domain-containing sensor histidine kinase [Hephaestia caeni]
MALLVAIALFVAQAINFGLLLHERQRFRFEQVTAPAITRMTDAIERAHTRPDLAFDRGRVRFEPHNPITPAMQRLPDVEQAIRDTLTDAGQAAPPVQAALHMIDVHKTRIDHIRPRHTARIIRRFGAELLIVAEVPGRGWLVQHAPWPRGGDSSIIWRLIGQTLILYVIMLIPVLWIGRRISRPLRSLAVAARDFAPGEGDTPLEERGPGDVRDVIAAFNALRLRVNAMLDEKDRMLGAIGHDLRTPLAALRVRIESVDDDNDRQRMAETIAEMNRTLDDILSLARLGRPSEPPTDVDLAALVDAVVEDFRDLGDNVAFLESGRLTMRLRPSLMRRAVRNLIENAIKYGGGAEVRIDRDDAEVRIVVADRGPGIPEDRLADVFDPFTRLETSRNRETGGAGLGLALARAIVRDAGGDIRLVNRAGRGLDAVIALPMRG